jgi:hypothetical protein
MDAPMFRQELLSEFFHKSRPSIDALAEAIRVPGPSTKPATPMFRFEGDQARSFSYPPSAFLLRTSVEYANPQLTLEELQGILLSRLLEASSAFVANHPASTPGPSDLREMLVSLERPPRGPVVPFLLNVDDIEADRYSVNPLRRSIVESGQSGRAVADVRTDGLEVDSAFFRKYSRSLVAPQDLEDIEAHLHGGTSGRYVDFVDATKYEQLRRLSERWGIDLTIPALRMPLSTLAAETPSGSLHRLIAATHKNPESLARIYRLFGRNFDHNRTFLPAVLHGRDGSASKRIAKGQYLMRDGAPSSLRVTYSSGPLYPNEVDREDVAQARATATVEASWEELANFDYRKTPASPQFALYTLFSPAEGAIWHGVGTYAGSQIVRSYTALRHACGAAEPFEGVFAGCRPDPLQFDLVAESMLRHPDFGNIDASVACVDDLERAVLGSTELRVLSDPLAPGTSAQYGPRRQGFPANEPVLSGALPSEVKGDSWRVPPSTDRVGCGYYPSPESRPVAWYRADGGSSARATRDGGRFSEKSSQSSRLVREGASNFRGTLESRPGKLDLQEEP